MVTVVACGACATEPEEPRPLFEDWTERSGLTFRHFNGMHGEFLFPEIVGAGVALFDFDRDGDLDLYLVQSGEFTDSAQHLKDRLLRNEWIPAGSLHFTDVTEISGIHATEYGIAVTVGDYDGDGHFGQAVELQRQLLRSVGAVSPELKKAAWEANLKRYEKRIACRSPWGDVLR